MRARVDRPATQTRPLRHNILYTIHYTLVAIYYLLYTIYYILYISAAICAASEFGSTSGTHRRWIIGDGSRVWI